jgi:hypothetical protein
MKFCHLGETKDGAELLAELVEMFNLEGLFPCNHRAYTDWADWYNAWKDEMLFYYHKNEEFE